MLDEVLGALASLNVLSDPLAWLVVATFVTGALLEVYDRNIARYVMVGAWVLFGLFWFTLIHHFAFVQKSYIEGVGTVIAVPLSVYVGYLLLQGRDSLFVLSRGVAMMGVVYMPFEMLPVLQRWLIETVARQSAFIFGALGGDPTLVTWSEAAARTAETLGMSSEAAAEYSTKYPDYRSTFYFETADGHPITLTLILACTGIGSMAIFAGIIAAVRAPMRRKLRALAVSIPVIYALNLVRNVFIAYTFGNQKLQVAPELIMTLFGTSDPYMVSYYWSDRIISQSLSVVALVVVTWLVVRELPEVLTVVEDLLYLVTGTEYDLEGAFGASTEVRADGEG